MLLHELQKSKGYKKKAIRRGRGNASGRGNYSTRGLKGQKARAGFSQHPGFEGGQTPLHQRLPKARGFKRYFKLLTTVIPLNLSRLEADQNITDGMVLSLEQCIALGLCKDGEMVKILGNGDITKKLTITDLAVSKVAKEKIEKAGGKVEEAKEVEAKEVEVK